MRLTRLRVAELRAFRQPFELAALQPGLNIVAGRNEAGKSSLVRAIRAAFLERHRSTAVEDLRPYGDAAAAPSVELDFDIGGTAYALRKSFLGRKRCELRIAGSRRLEGQAAEDHLAELLGFGFAPKGANRDEFLGLPGLLWVEQGSAGELAAAVGHAAPQLQRSLQQSVDDSIAALSAGDGDELIEQVRNLRADWLTATGKPRGTLLQAHDDAAARQAEVAALQAAATAYRRQVDELRTLRDEHAAAQRDAPWAELRQRQQQAEDAWRAAQGLAAEHAARRDELQQKQALQELLVQQLAAAARQAADLQARGTAAQAAARALQQATAAEQGARAAHAAAAEQARRAQATLALARQEDSRAQLSTQLAMARQRSAEAATRLQQAQGEAARAAELRRAAAAAAIEPQDLQALRERAARLQALAIRQSAIATRLQFELLPGAALRLDGEALQGHGERLLLARGELQIAQVGRLVISPGGPDLAELAAEQQRLQGEQQALLQRLGLADLDQAEARAQARHDGLQASEAAQRTLAVLAPQGLDSLQAALDAADAQRQATEGALAQLPPPAADAPPLAAAAAAVDAAQQAATAAAAALEQTRRQLAADASEQQSAERERQALAALLDSAEHRTRNEQAQARLAAGHQQAAALQATLQALQQRLDGQRPDILQQDIERLRRSAEQAQQTFQLRGIRIAQLEATLAAAGAQGLDEQLAQAQQALQQATRRHAELQRRAAAADLLLQRLTQHRQAFAQRLRAPLLRHLDRLLPLLLPGARLDLDEQLVPQMLSRPADEAGDAELAPLASLSHGAREQIGVAVRIACADWLREAGRPTLLMLDDALTHSDDERLARMKRLLFDAASRHQVLLFTCHAARWHDMGVPLLSIERRAAG
ncbi:MAG: AAA family ATPase [Proteobacteria bacterium]|nr:AAA family ATPase [Pseudomonadota bacterium]